MRPVSPATSYHLFVGVDIAAATATVAWQAPHQKLGKPMTIEQTPEGFSLVHQRLTKTGRAPTEILVVMEATGISWFALHPFWHATATRSVSSILLRPTILPKRS